MKSFIVSALTLLVSTSSFAGDSEKISAIVDTLSKWTEGGFSSETVSGKDAKAVMKYYATKIDKADEYEVIIDLDGKQIPEVDGGGDTYGVISAETARNMFESFFKYSGEPATEKQKQALTNMFNALERAGADFGYTPYGSSVCGTTWPGLVVIDVEGKKAYVANFVAGDC
jgi:hypothetical protein